MTVDRLLWAIFLPICLGVYSLHIWSVVNRDLANAAIYAAPPSGGDPYPSVGGLYPESHEAALAFRIGDRLLRLEDHDLRGVGYARFDGLLLELASTQDWVEVTFEREGEVRTTQLRAIPYPMPWHRLPMLVSLSGVGVIVMLRGRNRRQARLVFVGFLSLSLILAQFRGGPSWMTELGLYFRWIGVPFACAFAITAMKTVPNPQGRPTRGDLLLGVAIGAFSFLMRSSYHLEFPLPASLAPRGTLLSDVFIILAILTAPNWRAFPVSVPISCTLAAVPMLAGSILPVFLPGSNLAAPLHAVGYFALALIPMILLTRIVLDGLFSVDRILSAAATYTVLVTLAVGALLGFIPSLALGVSAITGIPPSLAQWLTALGLALVVVPITPWLRSKIERYFFPERLNFADGIEKLRVSLDTCDDAPAVLTLLGSELSRLLRVEHCRAYLRRGDAFYLCYSSGAADSDNAQSNGSIDAATPSETLRGVTSAILLDGAADTPFDAVQTSELRDLDIQVLLSIQHGAELAGFLCIGPKQSGDAYRDLEISRLTATADRATARLQQVQTKRLADEIEAADKEILSRSRFMARASHDLRQPLQALSLFAAALTQKNNDVRIDDLARNIGRSTDALRDMFEGLLDLSRIEAGSLQPSLRAVPLAPLFERLESELSPLASEKGLRLRVVPTSLSIKSDPALLSRILQNLLVNAIRYTERGSIVLGARRRGGNVHLEVVDSGPGIPAEYHELIFQEFERAGDDNPISDEGLGLGLAIVSRLAEQLDHRVELASERGRGSRFTVVAERTLSTSDPIPATHPAHQIAGLQGHAVLVIDDDERVRIASQTLIESWGCRVIAIGCIAEIPYAIEQFDGKVGAAIADYRLAAGETGIEAVRALRAAAGYKVPAVFVTGDSVGRGEMETDGLTVLTKPLAPARLRSVLVHLLGSERTQPSSARSV